MLSQIQKDTFWKQALQDLNTDVSQKLFANFQQFTTNAIKNQYYASKYYASKVILLGVLRIQTIYKEECEKAGFDDKSGDMTDIFTNMDKYLTPEILEKVYAKFMYDQASNFKRRGTVHNETITGPFVGFLTPHHILDQQPEQLNAFSQPEQRWSHYVIDKKQIVGQGKNMVHYIKVMLSFDLLKKMPKSQVAWSDIRISRKIFRKYITIGYFCNHTETKDAFESLLATIRSLVRGDFRQRNEAYLRYLHKKAYGSLLQEQERVNSEDYGPRFSFDTVCFQYANHQDGIIYWVQPRRVALYETIKDYKKKDRFNLVGFRYHQYVEIWDVLNKFKYMQQSFNKLALRQVQKNAGNWNTLESFKPEHLLVNIPHNQRRRTAQMRKNIFKIEFDSVGMAIYRPLNLPDKFLEPEIAQLYQRDPKFGNEFHYEKEGTLQVDKFRRADEQLVDQVSQETGSQQLLRLIKSIPRIKFMLTPEQELMIGTPQNLLVLGRSGTGKTTSSALRLFATDAYYKYHEELSKFREANPEAKNKDFVIKPNFVNQSSKLKLLFVSASPVLVNEIKRFYDDFKHHFALELEKSQLKKKQLLSKDNSDTQTKSIEEQKEGEQQQQSSEDKEPEEDSVEALKAYIQHELSEIEQDQKAEEHLTLAQSMNELSADDFPLFLTIKRLIYMLDASTEYPFFSRDKAGNQIGLESNVQWHNEQGGVLMINQYHKSATNYDKLVKEYGEKIIDINTKLDDQQNSATQNSKENEEQKKEDDYQGQKRNLQYDLNQSMMQHIVVAEESSSQSYSLRSQNLSFEVTFDTFETKFWPKVTMMTNLAPLVVWTEICSEIKGRVDSYKYEQGGIDGNTYANQANKKKGGFLTYQERIKIYMIFLRYEQWKSQMRAYDMNDVVNHVLKQIRSDYLKETQLIHFLMVDEVQDLTKNIISLLMTMADKNIFFSGDTAQTIAKGVGFRFFDLKSIFSAQNYEFQDFERHFQTPKVLQLTQNFRSHSRILDLANSVVSLLELLFPKTIDKLKKETSDLDGPKPIVIEQCSEQNLQNLLDSLRIWGYKSQNLEEEKKESEEQIGQASAKNQKKGTQKQQFGCDRVIIVRDQEGKNRVPEFMRNMLCLTVYEAKGLEFDEVILFNFFQDSTDLGQWKLLNEVETTQVIKKVKKQDDFLDFEMLEVPDVEESDPQKSQIAENEESKQIVTNYDPNQNDDIAQTKLQGDQTIETILSVKQIFDQVGRKFAKVCTELKLLYVAITRPKNLLIIYDQNQANRLPIQNYWGKVGVADIIKQNMTHNFDLIPKQIRRALRLDEEDMQEFAMISPEKVALKWRLQGFKLFKVRFYQAAIKCFQNSGDLDMVKRCEGFDLADRATKLRGQADSKMSLVKDKSNFLKKFERSDLKREAMGLKKESDSMMISAGHIFNEIDLNQLSAQCFFSAGDQKGASELFLKMNKFGQAAECFQALGKYRLAANLYAKASLFANAFESYERLEDWDGLIQCLHTFGDKLAPEERKAYIAKYFPLALNSVYQMYAGNDSENQTDGGGVLGGLSQENQTKIQAMKLKLKFQRSVSVIKEEDDGVYNEDDSLEEEEIDDDEESEQENQGNAGESNSKQSEIDEKNQKTRKVNEEKSEDSEDFSVLIDTSKKDQNDFEERKEGEDSSFEILEESKDSEGIVQNQSKQVIVDGLTQDTNLREAELDLLSQIDPNDEFLQSQKSFSLIEGVSLGESQFDVLSNQSSEFSIIGGSNLASVIHNCSQVVSDSSAQKTIELRSIDGKLSDVQSKQYVSDFLSQSSKYSVIQTFRDDIAEDLILQKVIFYVSLFNKQVKKLISGEENLEDPLSQIVDEVKETVQIQTDSKQGHHPEDALKMMEELEKAAFDEDMNFMMIELDELTKPCLNLILETLEEFELYRLCLILCNRFKLKENIGFYVSSIASKYSNLNNFGLYSFEKMSAQTVIQAQRTYALVSQEAMHNVLTLANFGQGNSSNSREINYRDQCFEGLFLEGFWKKLIFVLDVDNSLQLSYVMEQNCNKNLLLNYLVEKMGLKDQSQIGLLMNDPLELRKFYIDSFDSKTKTELRQDEKSLKFVKLREILGSGFSTDIVAQTIENKLVFDQLALGKGYHSDSIREIMKTKEIDSAKALILGQNLRDQLSLKSKEKYTSRMRWLMRFTVSEVIQYVSDTISVASNFSIRDDVVRTFMKELDIAWLDGLDLFQTFSSSYCIVNMKNCVFESQIKSYQQVILDFKRAKLLSKKLQEVKELNYCQQDQQIALKDYYKAHKDSLGRQSCSNLEDSTASEDELFAIPCDIDLNYFLVPKRWIREIVLSAVLHQKDLFYIINNMSYGKMASIQVLDKLQRLLSKMESMNSKVTNYGLQALQKKTRAFIDPHLFLFATSTQMTKFSLVTTKGISDEKQSLKLVQQLLAKASGELILASDDFIRQKPRFILFNKITSMSANERDIRLGRAIYEAQTALSQIEKKTFYSKILNAFKLFVQIDSYLVMSELLTSKMKLIKDSPSIASKKKITSSFNLLDANVYAKIGNYNMSLKSLFKFLQESFKDLKMREIAEIAFLGFFKSIFSYSIFTYKSRQDPNAPKGFLIPYKEIQIVDSQPITRIMQSGQECIELPEVFLKPATFEQTKYALSWISTILDALLKSDEIRDSIEIYKRTLSALHCIACNSDSQQVFEMRFVIADVLKGFDTHVVQLLSDNQITMGHFFKLEYLRHVKSQKDAKKVIQEYKKTLDQQKQGNSRQNSTKKLDLTFLNMVLFSLKDQKRATENQAHVENIVDQALQSAERVEKKMIEKRKKAADKIRLFVERKQQKIKIQQQMLTGNSSVDFKTQDQNVAQKEEQVSLMFLNPLVIQVGQLQPFFVKVMNKCEKLMQNLIGLVGSDQIRHSIDLKFVIKSIICLKDKRQAIQDFIYANFKLNFLSISEIKRLLDPLLTQFDTIVDEKTKDLQKWKESKQAEGIQVNIQVEKSKQKYLKLEKWNSVISYHRRKKVLLRHLKGTKK